MLDYLEVFISLFENCLSYANLYNLLILFFVFHHKWIIVLKLSFFSNQKLRNKKYKNETRIRIRRKTRTTQRHTHTHTQNLKFLAGNCGVIKSTS